MSGLDLDITLETRLEDTYRSNRVRSLFNVTPDQAATHRIQTTLPLDEREWRVGVVVGPSGTGKTSVGRRILGDDAYHEGYDWPDDAPIVDAIGPEEDFDTVTGVLASVGLGTVPSWLRPYRVLSAGEQFRADLARILIERPERVVVDEFTSVVDRQVACIGAQAFAKAWRRDPSPSQVVLLTPHYDVLDWLQPDWTLDTKDWAWTWGWQRRRPPIHLDVVESSRSVWPLFEPHHYLKLPSPIAPVTYVGLVDGEPVAHVVATTMGGRIRRGGRARPAMLSARFTRLVVMPEWQGAGVGLRFLDWIAEEWYRGRNKYSKRLTGIIHTSHPGLAAALRRRKGWVQTSAHGLGFASSDTPLGTNYGGHLRAVQGFRYVGDRT
jgi:GNAT superfamily N-acetyltransferase